MSVAAMLDLGADEAVLMNALKSLPLDGYSVEIKRVVKSGLDCCDFDVILESGNLDHDMEYLHGEWEADTHESLHSHGEHTHSHTHSHHHEHNHVHNHEHMHEHTHEHSHEHTHEHTHEHGHVHTHTHNHEHTHGAHSHTHRHLKEVFEIIDAGEMTDGARNLAKKIFEIIGRAEAKAHGKPITEVGFHEVGAVDSIVDIVAFSVCFDNLGITDVIVPKLNEGMGTVRCQHGVLPVPVPAVLNILAEQDMPIEIMNVKGEFITPTGAAIATAIATSHELPKTFKIKKVGLGAGKRNYERASLVRAILID